MEYNTVRAPFSSRKAKWEWSQSPARDVVTPLVLVGPPNESYHYTDSQQAPKVDERPSSRADQLLTDAAATITTGGPRASAYGSAIENFTNIADLWSVILGSKVTAEQVGLCMVALKIARLIKTPNHRDSFVDALGYIALTGDIAATPSRHG